MLISSFLRGRVLAYASKIYKKDQQRTDSNRCPEKGAHISPTAIDLARENGVVMLTIPPHTSHYLQPLDRTCYGPFKTAFGVAMDGWMRSHPGYIVTIYDVTSLVAEA